MTKRKIKDGFQRFAKYSALYAVLPAICVSIVILVMIIDSAELSTAANVLYSIEEDGLPINVIKLSEKLSEDEKEEIEEYNEPESAFLVNDTEPDLEKALEFNSKFIKQKGLPVVKNELNSSQKFTNQTGYSIDSEKYENAGYPFSGKEIGDDPIVLVLHTHATESFFNAEKSNGDIIGYYDENTETRTTDKSKNVVRVGEVFCETLKKNGIPNVHCTVLHDYNDYNNAYTNAQKSIEEYLEKYPSIRYIVDIHRDSIIRKNGDKIAPTVSIDGVDTAQVMIVAGTDEKGYYHPDWEKNMSVIFKYKKMTDEQYPSLMRPVNVRNVRFNQHYSPGSILLEIGSCGSTLSSCENAARISAKVYADMIKNYE